MLYKKAYLIASDEIESYYESRPSKHYSIFRKSADFKACNFYTQLFLKRLDFYSFYNPPRYAGEEKQQALSEHLAMLMNAMKILTFLEDVPRMTRRELESTKMGISVDNLLLLEKEASANHELIQNHLQMFIIYFHPKFVLNRLHPNVLDTIGGASESESEGWHDAIIIDTNRDIAHEEKNASCCPCSFFQSKKSKKEEPLFREASRYSPG